MIRRLRRLLNSLLPDRLDRDLQDELEFHRAMSRERGLGDGEARRKFGNAAIAREQMRDARVSVWFDSWLQDLRHGVLVLRRDRGVSALIVAVLALGIGGATAMFSLLKAAFLDELPFPDADRLVTVEEDRGWNPSIPEFLELRKRSRTLERFAFAEHRDMQLAGADQPVRVFAARITASFFPVLGAQAALGRLFADEDNEPGRTPAIVVSNDFWRVHMGSEASAIGKVLRLDGAPAVVVGVLAPGFHFDYPALRIPERVDLYVAYPLEAAYPMRPSESGWGTPIRLVARLRDGVPFAAAETEMRNLGNTLAREYPNAFLRPDTNPFAFIAAPLRTALIGRDRSLLWLLLSASAVLLLIACANVAQLLLARSLQRGREIATRFALGAGRLRLVRQFLLEGVVLAAFGGATGLILAGWFQRILVAALPNRSPLLDAARTDWRVLAFSIAISGASAVLFSIVPAIHASSRRPGAALGARGEVRAGNRWRGAMIAVESALSVFLLCGAGIVAQNLWTLVATPVGFDPRNVVAMRLQIPGRQQNTMDNQAGMELQRYVEKVAAIPGVESAATVTGPPMRPVRAGAWDLVEAPRPNPIIAGNHLVSKDYFRTLRIPVLSGRTFQDSDTGKLNVVVVNEEAARRAGFGRDIVGKHIFEPGGNLEIVGVVGNTRARSLQVDDYPDVYLPSLQVSWANVWLVIRSPLSKTQLVREVSRAVQGANPDQAVFGAVTMDEMISESLGQPRFHALAAGTFAVLALVMAAAGLFSVISCLVSQRTGEIAIRMALGARGGDVGRTVLGSTVGWMTAGSVVGLALALAASSTVRSLSSTMVDPSPWMYAMVVSLFAIGAAGAAMMPLRRAVRLDPSVALRCD